MTNRQQQMISMTKLEQQHLNDVAKELGITKSQLVNSLVTMALLSNEVRKQVLAVNEITLCKTLTTYEKVQVLSIGLQKITPDRTMQAALNTLKIPEKADKILNIHNEWNQDIERTIEIAKTKWVNKEPYETWEEFQKRMQE